MTHTRLFRWVTRGETRQTLIFFLLCSFVLLANAGVAQKLLRARLNCIAHLLSVMPWKRIPQEKVKLPKRQKPHGYKPPDWPYRWISCARKAPSRSSRMS